MASIIISYHNHDSDTAKKIEQLLKAKSHKTKLDENPFSENLWDGGWSKIYPQAEAIIVLITKKFSEHFSEIITNNEIYNIQKRITLGDSNIDILPIVIEKTDLPNIFIGMISIICHNQKLEIIAEHIDNYVNFLINKKKKVFKRILIFSTALLALSLFSFILMNSLLFFIQELITPIFVMSIGALGTVSYIIFNMLGIISEGTFKIEKPYGNYLRLLLGAIMGWASYIILIHTSYAEMDYFFAIAVVVSFLSGFSSKLVISLINKGISLIERGASIERD